MNPLQTCLHSTESIAAYQRMCQQLSIDGVVFDAMTQVANRRNFQFVPPTSTAQLSRKHEEIENLLGKYQNVLGRQGLFFDLVEEVYAQLQIRGKQALGQRLQELATVRYGDEFKMRLTGDSAWALEWDFSLDIDGGLGLGQKRVISTVYKSNWGEVIPWSLVQYLRSGVILFRQKSYATSLALMSIAVEATLRDVLSTRGYTFLHGASRANIYAYARAQIDVSGGGVYSLSFVDPVPQPPTNLAVSSGGTVPIDIEIRREENLSRGRIDLVVKCPPFLIDHLSSNRIVQPATTNNIGGLSEALQIAREIEHMIDHVDLPLDVDEVLKAIRNNLIHFSSDSLDIELVRYATYSPAGRFTLGDFLKNSQMIFDLITEIPQFVNDQYVKLWRNGIHVT